MVLSWVRAPSRSAPRRQGRSEHRADRGPLRHVDLASAGMASTTRGSPCVAAPQEVDESRSSRTMPAVLTTRMARSPFLLPLVIRYSRYAADLRCPGPSSSPGPPVVLVGAGGHCPVGRTDTAAGEEAVPERGERAGRIWRGSPERIRGGWRRCSYSCGHRLRARAAAEHRAALNVIPWQEPRTVRFPGARPSRAHASRNALLRECRVPPRDAMEPKTYATIDLQDIGLPGAGRVVRAVSCRQPGVPGRRAGVSGPPGTRAGRGRESAE